MARMPGATWRPVPNCTTGGQEAVYGVVLHIMEGTLDGSDAWFRNPAAQASSHFGVGRDGRICQWVDTADRAWAQSAGNRTWLSIEHEGHSGDSLTPAQLAATGRIVAWAHTAHGVPLQPTDSVTGRGIGWHGMGGAAWGGHVNCPGDPIKAQRAAIIAAAKGGTEEDTTMPLTTADTTAIRTVVREELQALLTTRYPSVADPAHSLYLRDHLRGEGVAALIRTQAAPVLTDAQLAQLAAKVAAAPGLAAAIATAVVDLEARRLDS
jgi:hypothetical protein